MADPVDVSPRTRGRRRRRLLPIALRCDLRLPTFSRDTTLAFELPTHDRCSHDPWHRGRVVRISRRARTSRAGIARWDGRDAAGSPFIRMYFARSSRASSSPPLVRSIPMISSPETEENPMRLRSRLTRTASLTPPSGRRRSEAFTYQGGDHQGTPYTAHLRTFKLYDAPSAAPGRLGPQLTGSVLAWFSRGARSGRCTPVGDVARDRDRSAARRRTHAAPPRQKLSESLALNATGRRALRALTTSRRRLGSDHGAHGRDYSVRGNASVIRAPPGHAKRPPRSA